MKSGYSNVNSISSERGVTMIEMLALIFVIYIPILVGNIVAKKFGVWAGIGAGVLTAVICVTAVILFYRATGRQHEQRRRELREKYRGIYRVISVPADAKNIKGAQFAEIKIGDYGWEAELPKGKDDLIYLQGLTDKWQVVWYAGFRLDQIERVGEKPRSQYDWDYSWYGGAPPCPYPVQKRKTTNMGLPDAWGWNGPRLT
jgi:membrane protein implicated in regulation of membrane protease activity